MNNGMPTLQPGGATTSLSRRRALGHLGMGALVVGALAGPAMGTVAAQATPAAGSIETVARQAIDAINEAMTSGETSALDAIFAADVTGHPPHRSLVTGEPFSHDLGGSRRALPTSSTSSPMPRSPSTT